MNPTAFSSDYTSRARITAIGSYVPQQRLTNDDLSRMVETNDEWIVQRTGIRERRINASDQHTSDLCIAAVSNLVERYQASLEDVELIIVATSTPDFFFPNTACLVQQHFGIPHTSAMDLSAACAGFVYGLHVANGMISSGLHRKVLVIGADSLSQITDYTDRTTCILFGDGAGAVLLERTEPGGGSFLSYHGGSDGSGGQHLYRSSTSATLLGQEIKTNGKIVQNGREVYKFAVQTVPRGIEAILSQTGLTADSIDWFIPHSANLRIIESICEKTGLPLEKTLHTIEHYGNTSAATIPLAMDQAVRQGLLTDGDKLLLYGFGGGLVHSGMLMEWRAL